MNPDTTSVIRDVALIVAAGLLASLCLVLLVVVLKLYRPLKETVHNSSKAAQDIGRVAGDLASVSGETANNLAQTSRNLVAITEKANEGTEELRAAVNSVNEAAQGIGSAATTATRVAEMVGRLIPQGPGGGAAASSGVGSVLRLVRGLFSSPRGEGGPGAGNGT